MPLHLLMAPGDNTSGVLLVPKAVLVLEPSDGTDTSGGRDVVIIDDGVDWKACSPIVIHDLNRRM